MDGFSMMEAARLVSRTNPSARNLLVCYFDDSGTHDGSRIVVFAGLIGEDEQWDYFEPRWNEKLARPLPGKPPLKRFHMFDCKWGYGEFAGYGEAERDAVTHDFRQIILDSGVIGVASAVSTRDWDEIVTGDYRQILGTADESAFAGAIANLDDLRSEGLNLVFDNTGPNSTARYAAIYDRFQAMHAKFGAKPLGGLAFLPMLGTPPLQGADMIAWETYFYAIGELDDESVTPRPHLARYIETGRFFALIQRRRDILANLDSLKKAVSSRPSSDGQPS